MEKREVVIVIFSVAIIMAAFGLLFILIFVLYKKKQRLHRNKLIVLTEEMLQSKIEIQEQAFNDISRELHDNIGQQLSLAKLNLNTLKEITNLRDHEKIESTRELVSDCIYQIRSIAKTLLGEKVSTIGIVEAIRNEAERINKSGLIAIAYSFPGTPIQPDPKKEIILFRIVQEAINNVLKHAAATRIDIGIHSENEKTKIFIQDNGKGFNLEKENGNGIGLLNMKNRAQTINAALVLNSKENEGTTIEIIF